jgi:uncharacterized membrane protein YgcG
MQEVDSTALKIAQEQKRERTMKIVFGIVVCVVVVIVTLSLYSILTQKCPSTSSNGYTPSLTCAGAGFISTVANAISWIQANFLSLLLVPVAFYGLKFLSQLKLTKINPENVDGTDTKPSDGGGDKGGGGDDGGGGEGGGGEGGGGRGGGGK